MAGSILGTSVQRTEDPVLLTGGASFVDNLAIEHLAHLVFVRSEFAHAHLMNVDTSSAASMPGVLAVLTADDLQLHAERSALRIHRAVARPILASGRVRFVGEPIVAIVAETRSAAVDAAATVVVDYDGLPSVTDPEAALEPWAPVQFDELGGNLAKRIVEGNCADPLSGAEVVVRGRIVNPRLAPMPMEGNAIAVVPGDDGEGHQLTVYVSTQMPHFFRALHLREIGLQPHQVRVIAPHVGGGFGAKITATEHRVAIAAAQRLGRPVKWVETRSENLVAMSHGRGQVQYIEMGFTRDARITGLRCRIVSDAGAYGGFGGSLVLGPTRVMAQGVYRIPLMSFEAIVSLTNTTPMGGFRGAGRPEATAFLERIMDLAADEFGMDPAEIRRRNFITPEEFPYKTVTGLTYDSGDYDLALTTALQSCDYERLLEEQAERRRSGDHKLLGIGMSSYVEITAGNLDGHGAGAAEFGGVEVHEDGSATVMAGTSAHGQGHATTFAMLVSDRLGISFDRVRYVQSDTALVPRGGGTNGSRSLQLGGSAVVAAADVVLERARALAAELLEASPEDIVVVPDGLGVAGAPTATLTWAHLAHEAARRADPLRASLDFVAGGSTYPFGAHVAVVEVDLETGKVVLLRHVAVDDAGHIIHPMIVHGQQQGGIAQGVSQALFEEVVYDADGNPRTATLADYAMPSAAEFPSFDTINTVTPTPMNPLGVKGIGESATVGATPAVQNAVVDALSHLGVRHLDIPCTPQRIWRAIEDARRGAAADPWREPPAAFSVPFEAS